MPSPDLQLARASTQIEPKQVILFKNGTSGEKLGKPKQITVSDWNVFLKQCANKVGVKAKRLFKESGQEITSLGEIEANENIYVSAGEDFIKIN